VKVFKKSAYVLIAALAISVGWFLYARSRSNKPSVETVPVERRDLVQTVEVTGQLKPAARIELAFKQSGTIGKINVHVGDVVKVGDILAELKADDVLFAERTASAARSAAEANLAIKRAGETRESIRVAETSVEQAQASVAKAVTDLESTTRTTQENLKSAEIALQTAQNNLNTQNAVLTQNVQNTYDSSRTTLLTALGSLNTGLTDGDQISGVENTAANQNYVNLLGFLDAGSLDRAKASYRVAKETKFAADALVNALNGTSNKEEIQAAARKLQTAIALTQTYLTDIQRVLAASLTNASFTSVELAAKKTTIDADRTSVSTQSANVLGALQAIKNAELAKTQTSQALQDAERTARNAVDMARTNAEVQVRVAEKTIGIQKASLDAARAALDLKKSPPRDVDLAPLRAALQQATVAHEKAQNDLHNVQIVAAVSGTIAEVLPSVGEQIAQTTIAIRMIGTETYTIEAQVPEADISRIAVGQTAVITLDAYGDDVKLSGTVTAKHPAETRVQDAIYYKINVEIKPAGRDVKPGMTANVTIKTGERLNVLVIPLRAVRTRADGKHKTVRVLENGIVREQAVELGMKGDEGRVEIVNGLSAWQKVVVSDTNSADVSKP